METKTLVGLAACAVEQIVEAVGVNDVRCPHDSLMRCLVDRQHVRLGGPLCREEIGRRCMGKEALLHRIRGLRLGDTEHMPEPGFVPDETVIINIPGYSGPRRWLVEALERSCAHGFLPDGVDGATLGEQP